MTFSISARCAQTGMFGIAICSSSPAVAARCAHARAGVGVVASQNITDPRLGPLGLDLMAEGASATSTIHCLQEQRDIEYRQLAVVDAKGRTATFSGAGSLGVHSVAQGDGAVAAGNLLADENVPRAMIERFKTTGGHLGDRLLMALEAAIEAGGEEGPVHSAGLLLVRDVAWPVADLRVDWHDDDPVGALRTVWDIFRPQMDAYVTRALHPGAAPSFAVPGDQ
jgi:uncharacterized Ntn-hydrolase superfamily protein